MNNPHFPREANGEEVRLEVVRGRAHSRHTLPLGGAPTQVLQEMLGHAQITLTFDTYSHVLPGVQGEGVGSLGARLS